MNIFYKILNKIDWTINVFRSNRIEVNHKLQVISTEDSLDYLIDSKCSLARFGDGEFTLMMNNEFLCPRNISLQQQDADPKLKRRLLEILKDKNIDQYNLKLAVPSTISKLDKDQLTDSAFGFWERYLHEFRYQIFKTLNQEYLYLNAKMSRFYFDDRSKKTDVLALRESLWKKLWNNQDLLIVENSGSNLGKNLAFYDSAKSVERIQCPNRNSFAHYEEILATCKKLGQDKLIILSLGPTATLLAYDLAKEGFRALDLGFLELEYYLFSIKATELTTIEGIKVAEVESIEHDPFPHNKQINVENQIKFRIPQD